MAHLPIGEVTFPVDVRLNPSANASTARMEEISCTRALVSRGFAVWERSWESFAWRQGWVEMWMFWGWDIIGIWNIVEGVV